LEARYVGKEKNSIGSYHKSGIKIDGFWTRFQNAEDGYFEEGDIIGIGLVYQPNSSTECFATWNGQLLGKIIEKYLKI